MLELSASMPIKAYTLRAEEKLVSLLGWILVNRFPKLVSKVELKPEHARRAGFHVSFDPAPGIKYLLRKASSKAYEDSPLMKAIVEVVLRERLRRIEAVGRLLKRVDEGKTRALIWFSRVPCRCSHCLGLSDLEDRSEVEILLEGKPMLYSGRVDPWNPGDEGFDAAWSYAVKVSIDFGRVISRLECRFNDHLDVPLCPECFMDGSWAFHTRDRWHLYIVELRSPVFEAVKYVVKGEITPYELSELYKEGRHRVLEKCIEYGLVDKLVE